MDDEIRDILSEALQAVTVFAAAPTSGFPPGWEPGAQRYLDLHDRIMRLLESRN